MLLQQLPPTSRTKRALYGPQAGWTTRDELAALTLETLAELTQRYGKVNFKPPRGGWKDPALRFPRPWDDDDGREQVAASQGLPVAQRPPHEVMALIFKQRIQADPAVEGQPKRRTAKMRDRSAPSGMYARSDNAAQTLPAGDPPKPARPRDARGRFVKASDIPDGG